MRGTEIEKLVERFLARICSDPQRHLLLDAVYYWVLCCGSSGAERSFYLKYGRLDEYIRARREILRTFGKLVNNPEVTDTVLTLVEKVLSPNMELDVQERVKKLDSKTLHVVLLLGRLRVYECLQRDSAFILECSAAINNVVRRLLNYRVTEVLETLNKIVSTGLLVACAWAPYEGLPHLYLTPKYAMPVWRRLAGQ